MNSSANVRYPRDASSIFIDNPEEEKKCNAQYLLRERIGDIAFIVEGKEIRASKCDLKNSPKYKAQFCGQFADSRLQSIEIKDVSAAAFEEYLQFFYFGSALLTHKNIDDVLMLTQSCLVESYFDGCIEFLSESLNVDNLCQTYNLAIKYEQLNLIERCEREISLYSHKLFSLKDFLECTPSNLFNILQSDAFSCREIVVFEACILWAKRKCKNEKKDPDDMHNLRAALNGDNLPGELFHQIRIGTMSIEEFMKCYKNYKELFTGTERDEILFAIGKVCNSVPKLFNNEPRYSPYVKWNERNIVECNRIIRDTGEWYPRGGTNRTIFSCNRKILLGGFYLNHLYIPRTTTIWKKNYSNEPLYPETECVTANISINQKQKLIDRDGVILFNSIETINFTRQNTLFELWRPIMIQPDILYEIKFFMMDSYLFQKYEFQNEVVIDDNQATITFLEKIYKNTGIVTSLLLNYCNEN